MVELNEKAVEAAREAYTITKSRGVGVEFEDGALEDAIIVYLSALPAPDDGLVERLENHANAAASTLSANSMMPPEMSGLGDLESEALIELCREAATALQSKDEQIERLREALNLIDALDPEGQIYGVSPDACRGLIARMGNIARSALTQEGER